MANENIIPNVNPEDGPEMHTGEQPQTVEDPVGISPDPDMQNSGLSEEEMKGDIDRKMADAENQNSAIESKKIIAKNKIKEFKVTMLRDIYAMLQELGVEPSDPESIKNFLLSIEQQDPDLLVLFETIFDTLSPDSQSSIDSLSASPEQAPIEQMPAEQMPVEQPMDQPQDIPIPGQPAGSKAPTGGQNLMDKYNNLQEGILR